MIISKIVEHNFSRFPEEYNNIAETQKKVAAKIANLIAQEQVLNSSPVDILEIGCGTGFLTKDLMTRFPKANFTVTDISPAMLSFCKNSMPPVKSANFAICDITTDTPGGMFDIITSSLAFQWIEDMRTLAKNLCSHLKPGGSLIFSTLTEGTFANIADIFKKQMLDFPMPKLVTASELTTITSCFQKTSINEEIFTETYDSIKDFLNHIHHVGAGNATGEHIPVSALRKIIREEKNNQLTVEYNVAFIECRKIK